jgi:hypothetical protein
MNIVQCVHFLLLSSLEKTFDSGIVDSVNEHQAGVVDGFSRGIQTL